VSGRPHTIIAGVLILISLLVFLGGYVPFMNCPYRAWEKTNHRDSIGPYGCLPVCKSGRVSLIYWWKHKSAMEERRSLVP
jgi:hypothetical protein